MVVLGVGLDVAIRGAHLSQHFVQPLEGAVEIDLDPAWGGCDHLQGNVCVCV